MLTAACGWSHSAIVVESRQVEAQPEARRKSKKAVRLFARGDIDGLFGQLLGTGIQFLLLDKLLSESCGFDAEMLRSELLPGVASVYFFGHLFFALQGTRLAQKTGRPVTAFPQGVNIVPFFAFTQLIMAPTYREQLQAGAPPDVAARRAYDTGLAAAAVFALLELIGVPFVDTLRRMVPRAAMLSAISGVSLTFISMGFAVEIFAAPGTALVPWLLMLVFYGGGVRLPFKLPGGMAAVAVAVVIANVASRLGYAWFMPPVQLSAWAPSWRLPQFHFYGWIEALTAPGFGRYISVIVPMWLVNLVNNLANLESAATVGDAYDARACLLGNALLDLFTVALGNPYPSCVYIGHSAFKAMGARVGYLYLNLVPIVFFGVLQGASVLAALVPIEGCVGFLFWIGLQITASGFEGDKTPEGWKHGPAVALGLIPSIAAWSWNSVSSTFDATRALLCRPAAEAAAAGDSSASPLLEALPTGYCTTELADLIQRASTPIPEKGPLVAFQEELSPLYLSGMYALSNGYLLSAIVLSSLLVHIIDSAFLKASLWLLLAAAAASVGVIHARAIDPYAADQRFSVMYLIAAAALGVCHMTQNRAEQLKELQIKWAARLRPLFNLLGLPLAPAEWQRLRAVAVEKFSPVKVAARDRRSSVQSVESFASDGDGDGYEPPSTYQIDVRRHSSRMVASPPSAGSTPAQDTNTTPVREGLAGRSRSLLSAFSADDDDAPLRRLGEPLLGVEERADADGTAPFISPGAVPGNLG